MSDDGNENGKEEELQPLMMPPLTPRQKAKCICRLEVLGYFIGVLLCVFHIISIFVYDKGHGDICFEYERWFQFFEFIGLDLILLMIIYSAVYTENYCQLLVWLWVKVIEFSMIVILSIPCIPYKYTTYKFANGFYVINQVMMFVLWFGYKLFTLFQMFKFKASLEYDEQPHPEEFPQMAMPPQMPMPMPIPMNNYRKESPTYLII